MQLDRCVTALETQQQLWDQLPSKELNNIAINKHCYLDTTLK